MYATLTLLLYVIAAISAMTGEHVIAGVTLIFAMILTALADGMTEKEMFG